MYIDRGIQFELLYTLAFTGAALLVLMNLGYLFLRSFPGIRARLRKLLERLLKKDLLNRPRLNRGILLGANILLIAFTLSAFADMLQMPHVERMYPTDNLPLTDFSRPIEVVFNRPLNTDTIKPYIFPELPGRWVVEPLNPSFPQIKRVLRFYPSETAFPGEKLFLYYAGISSSIAPLEPWEFAVNAYTTAQPGLDHKEPQAGAMDVPVSTPLRFVFDRSLNSSYEWKVESEPPFDFTQEITDNVLTVIPGLPLNHNSSYTLKLYGIPIRFTLPEMEVLERGTQVELADLSFTTVSEPLIGSIEPGNGALTDTPVKILFDQEMARAEVEANFKIEPQVEGSFSWDNNTLIFNHSGFAKDTSYTVSLPSRLRSTKGGLTLHEVQHSFRTIGPVTVSSFSPANSAGSVNVGTTISVSFNQEVDHTSAQSLFSINPSVSGKFSWNGNTLNFDPDNNLSYQTTYTVSIAAGVKTVKGLDSNSKYSASFTTQTEQVLLNVPVYYQKLRFSCNLEAARMALAYRGIYKSVDNLHSEIAKDTTAWDEANNIFGNPYNGYTGDIYGVSKGYGVYWPPLSAVIGRYRSNSIRTGWTLSGLLEEVQKGNPVVIWAHNGYSYAGNVYYWNTPGGESIRAVTGMHSYVVVGYKGSADNPSHVILNDSNRGRWTVTKDYFLSLWGYFNNTGIVVY